MTPVVLFVCTGNICRSPMAAAILNSKLAQKEMGILCEAESAGTWGLENQTASEYARIVMERRGLSLSQHRARPVSASLVDKASVIFVMAQNHETALRAEFPQARDKIHLISELGDLRYDITDPMGRSLEEYEACAEELEDLIDRGFGLIIGLVTQAAKAN